jgi:hypothetical protein
MDGTIVVENSTGAEVTVVACDMFEVALSSAAVPLEHLPSLLCGRTWTIPVGESRYPRPVLARYLACAQDGAPSFPACGSNGPPPLPPGDYEATVYSHRPLPDSPPIVVTVTP